MGLFSGKKITYVSSVAYNMAGDADGRVDYLKTLILKNITSDTQSSIADSINDGELHGPNMDFRKFYRWAKDNYTTVGMPTASINGYANIDPAIIVTQLPIVVGATPYVIAAFEEQADYTSWAEQYILVNRPADYDTAWESLFLDNGQILIQFADASSVTFTPVGFDQNAQYLYVNYAYYTSATTGSLVTGTTNIMDAAEAFPDHDGYTIDFDTNASVTGDLNTNIHTVVTYSDGTPTSTTDTNSVAHFTYSDREARFTKTDPAYVSDSETGELTSRFNELYYMTNPIIDTNVDTQTSTQVIGGVTITTTVTTTTETLDEIQHSWRLDTTDSILSGSTGRTIWLYKINSGNTVIDEHIAHPVTIPGEFFPPIPVRISNDFLTEAHDGDLYTQSAQAYKKMTGKKFSTVVDSISDNESLSDIDFAFVVFGVSLNVIDTQCKKYVYDFFYKLMTSQQNGADQWANFQAAKDNYQAAVAALQDWLDGGQVGTKPNLPSMPDLPQNLVRIHPEGTSNVPYDIRIAWNFITESTGTGRGKDDAIAGDLWFTTESDEVFPKYTYSSGTGGEHPSPPSLIQTGSVSTEHIRLWWQVTDTNYKVLDIYGMVHHNYVYDGKSVDITAKEALADADESGFIVPMHYDTMRAMSLLSSNQMTTACCFMVFNCYQIVKQKWYQTGIFKILLIVVVAIVSVAFTGGAGIGLLGSNIAVGTSLGFSGITAAIVGSVANALAAVVVSSVISAVTSRLGVLGQVLGLILGFVVGQVAQAFQGLQSFQFNWGDLMRPDNLLKLTDAVGNGISAYMNSVTQSYQGKIEDLQTSFKNQSDNIKSLYDQNIGYTNVAFNPTWMTQSTGYKQFEPSSSFLTRTLMTGSDIAQMSYDMVSDYTTLNLTLPSVYG
jgi:hypothetical protein